MATFEVLDELMEITGSTELHKRMRFWFRRVLIREIEALGERGVAVDSLESLKQTHARETAKLAALTDAIAESLAGFHEKECHVGKLDLNDLVFIDAIAESLAGFHEKECHVGTLDLNDLVFIDRVVLVVDSNYGGGDRSAGG
nr:glycoside hydrolase, family 79 [Tanacetum cinerariifolium]